MAKKMILIDPRLLENQKAYVPPDTLNDSLRELDSQMQQVLEREDLLLRDKTRLYQQTLQRYLNRLDQHRQKPLGLVDLKQTIPEPALITSEPTVVKEESVQQSPVVTPSVAEATPPQAGYQLRKRKKKSRIPTPIKTPVNTPTKSVKWDQWPQRN